MKRNNTFQWTLYFFLSCYITLVLVITTAEQDEALITGETPNWTHIHRHHVGCVTRAVYLLHRKGSVLVDYSLWVYSSLDDEELLKDVLRNQSVIKIGGFDVDRESIKVSSKFYLPFKYICYMICQQCQYATKHHSTFILNIFLSSILLLFSLQSDGL